MAISTYTELKSTIANWLNRSDLTSEISDDFIKLVEADLNAKLRIRQMEQIDTTGLPRVYTIESDNGVEQFRFAPSPDTTYTGYLQYYKAFTPLSSGNASNYILASHPSVYLYGSLFHAANFIGGIDQAQVQNWIAMYQTALERLESNDQQDSFGGSPVVQNTDVGTDLSFYRRK
jgi:hypothetical protein